MRKTISLIAILFCFAISSGQSTKPTKQETMDWIGKILVKNTSEWVSDCQFIEGHIIKYKYTFAYGDNREFISITFEEFDLNKITKLYSNSLKGKDLVKCFDGDHKFYKFDNSCWIKSTDEPNQDLYKFDLTLSQGLSEKFSKAIIQLIEYNIAEDKF